MSKVQDAINATREKTQSARPERRRAPSTSSAVEQSGVTEQAATLMHLEGRPVLPLDSKQMESCCILPFIRDKGAINAYNQLRTRLLKRLRDNDWKALMVTGTLPNDGKSTTAINVAIGASQDVNQAVLLVDLDLERPSIAGSLGLRRTAGLSEYLRGEAEVGDILYNTDVERLLVLPNFEPDRSSDSFISPRMLMLFEHLKSLDPNLLLILDMPPILSSDSVLAIAPHVDALLLVIAEGQTNRNLLQRASQMIEDIPRAGIVLNRSMEGNSGVGYY